MTRAVNVNASVAEVTAACAKMGAAISSIEQLAGAGTRVVLKSIESAHDVRTHYKNKLLDARAPRLPTRLQKYPG
ncbi:hypothetical protein [Sphingomonas oleivorans]|uniref:hypothetical protein n=1 Tax=Sphingomonas oleivorans TaxID=1735121 RepID=UPI001056F939|nr:hypothetical protein [Sphingomonas oleivorans]